jgi:hypothetical protein
MVVYRVILSVLAEGKVDLVVVIEMCETDTSLKS